MPTKKSLVCCVFSFLAAFTGRGDSRIRSQPCWKRKSCSTFLSFVDGSPSRSGWWGSLPLLHSGRGPVREISRYPSSRLGLTGARGGGRFKLVERCTHFRAWPRFQHGCVNVVAHLTARLCVALVALSPIEATRLRRSVYFQGSRCLFFFFVRS